MDSLNFKLCDTHQMGKLLLIPAFMLAFFSKSYSQAPAKRETIAYLNQQLGAQIQLSVTKGNLIITFKNETGELTREDLAPLDELETNAFYEVESGLLVVPCLKRSEGCVTKSLYLQKIKRPADRISFKAKDEAQFKILQKGIEHLIRLETEIGYKDEIVLE